MSAERGGQLFAEGAGRRVFGRRRVRGCAGAGRADLKAGRAGGPGGGEGKRAASRALPPGRAGTGPWPPPLPQRSSACDRLYPERRTWRLNGPRWTGWRGGGAGREPTDEKTKRREEAARHR